MVYFLPPYRPDFNPIEEAFSKVKSVLIDNEDAWSDWDVETAVSAAFNCVTSEDCHAWVAHCGYQKQTFPFVTQNIHCIYIYNSVCLFVCCSGKNYCTGRHQTLRNYKVGLQKCPPQVEIARLAVLEELSFHFRFFVRC